MPQPTYQSILHLLTYRKHDGVYINGFPEVLEWLDENPDKTYYIQQMEDELGIKGYHNVRIWSSLEAYEDSIMKRKFERAIEILDEVEKGMQEALTLHPLVAQLYEACEKKDIDLVYELKKRCRSMGLKFDRQRTIIMDMI